ncbi:MAG: hypothetical protein SVW02_03225 [Candidatus Nanohaloarchaea archaeon]|nr:hypothetical protein [Candidatus Nanohaloarchaea archaeon]
MAGDMDDFVDTVRTGARPAVLAAFDRFTAEIEDAYKDAAGTEAIDIVPERGAGMSYAGPVMGGGEARNTRSYTAVIEDVDVAFDLRVRDYTDPDLEGMIDQEGEDTVVVPSLEPSRERRDLILTYTGEEAGRARTFFDLLGDTVYDLLDSDAEDYQRSDDPPTRTFTFERRNVDGL